MAARTRDHEPPAAPASVAVVLGCIALYLGLVIPAEQLAQHVALGGFFGAVGLLSGWRAIAIGGRRRAARRWAWAGIVIIGVAFVAMAYQLVYVLSGGAVPPPFWSPYAAP
ncbi:hypothetical protein ASG04_14385 [Curtobacterium sp. Leaf183]|uniref:hypothetical protein n=1 Tax=Curtobacterium sp. Leaf183 TaxID=1736291 RepID=UPI0006FA5DE1|nr:hypothetical protein [Curtobacterium sp. Leaf183]KQS08293.1 hypothetical protein ASG04_14385 [Curtobacterium sp. Leaf183]